MLTHTIRNYSDLRCHLVDADRKGESPRQIVVFCHGFGAPGTDLVPLAEELFATDPEWGTHLRFVFPEAPLGLEQWGMPGGRAWWLIDMMRLTRLNSVDALRDYVRECPDGMDAAAGMLNDAVAELLSETGLPPAQCVMGGFSQGAMIATHVALSMPDAPAGLCVLSGMLIDADDWTTKVASRAGLPVFQSHGTQDPLLPIQGAEWLRDMFQQAGCKVEFHAFAGGHTIPRQAMRELAHFLRRL